MARLSQLSPRALTEGRQRLRAADAIDTFYEIIPWT